VKHLHNGDHVDSLAMLGVHERCYWTITAERTCHVLILSRQSYLQVSESCGGLREEAQMLKQEELLYFEELKSQEVRTARNREQSQAMIEATNMSQGRTNPKDAENAKMRTMIQKEIEKSGGNGICMNWDHWEHEYSKLSMKEVLQNVIRSWAAWTRRSGLIQRTRRQRNQDIDQWKERCAVARAERERRKKEQKSMSARCPRLPSVPVPNTPRCLSARRILRAPACSKKIEELSSMYLADGRGLETSLPPLIPHAPAEIVHGGSRNRYGGRGGGGLDVDVNYVRTGQIIAGKLRLSQLG
jgi:hypothetical protein